MTPSAPRLPLPIGAKALDDGDAVTVVDAFTGAAAFEVATADAGAVDAAVAAARDAAAAPLPAHRRAAILRAAAGAVAADAERFAEVVTTEAGKPRRLAATEVARTVETLEWSAEEAKRIAGEAFPLDASPSGEGRFAVTLRQPVGVVAAMTPTNAPLNLVAHKVGPALAAGNSVVLKPAQATPVSALLLAGALRDAGLPPGHLNVVVGPGVGDLLLADQRIDFYNLTGSTAVGEHLRRTVGLRDALLELGGNSPVLIHHDADVAAAAQACASKGFGAAGQACTSVQRVYVHDDVAAAFLDAFVAAAEALRVGDPHDPATDVGPLLHDRDADRVVAWVDEAVAAGARRLTGGGRRGKLLDPIVLVDVPDDARVLREEVFGPVVVVVRYRNLDAAISAANSTCYGLHAAVFTRSLDVAFSVAQRLEAGGVVVNDASQWRTEFVPFGGVKQSGSGREGPRYAIEAMTRQKVVLFALETPR